MNDDGSKQRLQMIVNILEDFFLGRYDKFKTTVPYRDIEELCLRITEQRRQTHA